MATVTEIRTFFQNAYKAELAERLTALAEDGELDNRVDGTYIDGDILTGVDETANSATKQEFGWRDADAVLTEALEQPECYEGIDYAAIVEEARKVAV